MSAKNESEVQTLCRGKKLTKKSFFGKAKKKRKVMTGRKSQTFTINLEPKTNMISSTAPTARANDLK